MDGWTCFRLAKVPGSDLVALKRKRSQLHEVWATRPAHPYVVLPRKQRLRGRVFISIPKIVKLTDAGIIASTLRPIPAFNPDDRDTALLSKLVGKGMRVPVLQLSFASSNTYKFPAVLINIQALVHSPSRRLLSLSSRLSPSVRRPNSTALHSSIALHLVRNFFALLELRAALISDSSASFISTVPPQLHS
jgi:hypothetical protein